MDITGFNHISINVKKIDESISFYRDLLGFEELETVDMDGFAITYFKIPNGGRLELFDYFDLNKEVAREESDVGLRHLAFTVNGVAEHEKFLREAGVTITLSTTDLPSLKSRVLLFLDPNGVTLEFCESL